jgi:Cu(I)/Ag(I) efflux system membrane fusion protein
MKGELLYRIADLTRVWVLADVHPGDAALQGAISRARIRIEGAAPLPAQAAAVPPQFDQEGRIGKLRFEVNNPQGRLVPGMLVDVDLDLPARPAITVPTDAVIDSGTTAHIFVALGGAQYELREVQTGWQEGDRVEIREGLKAGERVVTAGAFLLDSESRIRSDRPSREAPPR